MSDEQQIDIVEIEDNVCTCGKCVSCKLRELVRKAEEEAQQPADYCAIAK